MYTYAFLNPAGMPLELPEGIAGPLQLLGSGQLLALVEPDLELNQLQTSDERLVQAVLDHDRVVQQLFRQTTILPLRFGTSFASAQGLLDHLATHEPVYRQQLAQLNHKAEYRLKLIPVDVAELPIAADLKGKDYFLAKKQQYQNYQERQARQQAELKLMMHALKEAYLAGLIANIYPQTALNLAQIEAEKIYLLLDNERIDAFYHGLQSLQHQCSHWQRVLEEPLPPYHVLTSDVVE